MGRDSLALHFFWLFKGKFKNLKQILGENLKFHSTEHKEKMEKTHILDLFSGKKDKRNNKISPFLLIRALELYSRIF